MDLANASTAYLYKLSGQKDNIKEIVDINSVEIYA